MSVCWQVPAKFCSVPSPGSARVAGCGAVTGGLVVVAGFLVRLTMGMVVQAASATAVSNRAARCSQRWRGT